MTMLFLDNLLPPLLRGVAAAMEARFTATTLRIRRQRRGVTGWLLPVMLERRPPARLTRSRTLLAAASKDGSSSSAASGGGDTKKKKAAAVKKPSSPFLDQPPAYLHMVFPGGDSAAASVAYHHTDSHVPHVLRVRLETRPPSSTSPPSSATEPLLLAEAELVKQPETQDEMESNKSRRKVWGTRIWVGDRPGQREASYEVIAQGMGAAHALGLRNLHVFVDETEMAEEICGHRALGTTSSAALKAAHEKIQSSIRYFPSFSVFISGAEGSVASPFLPIANLVGKEGDAEDLEPHLPSTTLTPSTTGGTPPPPPPPPPPLKEKPITESSDKASTSSLIDPAVEYLVRFDGGSRGNPGPSGAGVVIFEKQAGGRLSKVRGAALWLGADPPLTNNEAEYKGLIAALQAAKSMGIKKLCVEGDSQLIVRQLLGEYKVRNERLKPLHAEAMALMGTFTNFDIKHIERAENQDADALCNQAMDDESSRVVGPHGLPVEDTHLMKELKELGLIKNV